MSRIYVNTKTALLTTIVLALLLFTSQILVTLKSNQDRPHDFPSKRAADWFHPAQRSPLAVEKFMLQRAGSDSVATYKGSEYFRFNDELSPATVVNNVPESVRRLFVYKTKPAVQIDYSKDYVNRVFNPERLDKHLWISGVNSMNMDELIYHINTWRYEIRRKGEKMDIFDEETVQNRQHLDHWERWYLNISQFEVYRHDDPAVQEILVALATEPIVNTRQMSGGTQFKLGITFETELRGLWKPMRYPREQETLENHYYFSDFERHHAEIAAYHLDKILGYRRIVPVSGRILNITEDIEQYATHRLLDTVFWSPTGNRCFFGKCAYYCDSNHAICGHPDWIEGSVAAFLPPEEVAPRRDPVNPWKRSYSRRRRAEWEDDPNYCKTVKAEKPFSEGRLLLDLIDLHIFDFIQGNMDRHNYDMFWFPDDWKNNTAPISLDNGRGWGKMYRDEVTILAPLYQCCMIRHTTLQKVLLYDGGPYKLSQLLNHSTQRDPLYPILAPPHLAAADRRVKIILDQTQTCIEKNSWESVVVDDGY